MVKTRAMHSKVSQSLLSDPGSSSRTSRSSVTRGKVTKKTSLTQIYKQLAEIPYNERRIAKGLLIDNSDKAWDEFVAYHLAHICGRCTNYPNIQPTSKIRRKPIPPRIVNCVKMGLKKGKQSAKEIVGLALEYAYHSGALKKPYGHRKCYELVAVGAAKTSSKRTIPALAVDKAKLRPKDSREIYRRRQKSSNRYNDETREDESNSEPTERQKPTKFKPKHRTTLQILSKSDITTTCIEKGEIIGNVILSSDITKDTVKDTVAKGQGLEYNTTQMSSNLEVSNVNNDNDPNKNKTNENTVDISSLNYNIDQGNSEGCIFVTSKHSIFQPRKPFIIDSDTTETNNAPDSSSNQHNAGNLNEELNPFQYFM